MYRTVVELPGFLRAARIAGMSDDDRADLVALLAADPLAGVSLGGGLRKVRIARRGQGKSGGFRTIHFYSSDRMPVFLLACFAKNQRGNITEVERKSLLDICAALETEFDRRG
jgi:hypothetical protein